jgi:cell division protein FtsZ
MFEVREVMDYISTATSAHSHVFYGQVFDESLEDKLKVTVIATGFPPKTVKKQIDRGIGKKSPAMATIPSTAPAQAGMPSEDDLRRPAYLRLRNRKLK